VLLSRVKLINKHIEIYIYAEEKIYILERKMSREVDLVSSFGGAENPINTLTVLMFVERGATRVLWFFDGVLSRTFHHLVRKELTF